MRVSDYPTENIHLPPHSFSIRFAYIISFVGGIIVTLSACIIFIAWFLKIDSFATFFGRTLINIPIVIALIGCSIIIFFYNSAKRFLLVILSIIIFCIGLVTVLTYFYHPLSVFSAFSAMNLRAGLIFILLGYSLLISISHMRHRFHYSQLILFIALFLGLFGFLENVYQLISPDQFAHVGEDSVAGSFLLFILCQSLLLTKSNRGFLGLFMTDTNSSMLARFSLISYSVLPPLLGLLFMIEEKISFLNTDGRVALLIVVQMIISVIVTWINAKRLYPSEVKNYLTKEALRVNNITLEIDAEDLSSKMDKLEKEKKTVVDKLENKEKLMNYVEQVE